MAIGTPAQRYAKTGLTSQTSTSVINVSTTVAAGTLAVLMAHSGQSKVISSVADAVGNTWTVNATGNGGSGASYISFASCQVATQITSADNITITWSAATSAGCEIWIYEVATAATSSAYDKSAFAQGTLVAVNSGNTATLTQADEAVFGISRIAASRTFTKGASYSESANPLRGSTTSVAYKVVAATTAVAFDGTWSGADGTAAVTAVATYKGLPTAHNVDMGLNTEDDTALTLGTSQKSLAFGINAEADTALAMTASKSKAIGIVSETDTAQQQVFSKTATVQDNFEDASIHAKYVQTVDASTTITESGGFLNMEADGTDDDVHTYVRWGDLKDLTSSYVLISMLNTPDFGSQSWFLRVTAADGTSSVKIECPGGGPGNIDLTTDLTILTGGSVSSTDAAWVKISESAGTVTCSYSRAGSGFAVEDLVLGTVATTSWMSACFIEFGIDVYDFDSFLAQFDNLNFTTQVVNAGLNTETDSALAMTVLKTRNVAVGLNTETDTALAMTAVKSKNVDVGLNTETDTALAMTVLTAKNIAVGLNTETDTALPIVAAVPHNVTIGICTERDGFPNQTGAGWGDLWGEEGWGGGIGAASTGSIVPVQTVHQTPDTGGVFVDSPRNPFKRTRAPARLPMRSS